METILTETNVYEMSDREVRLKCLELAGKINTSNNWDHEGTLTSYTLMLAQEFYNFVTESDSNV